MYVAINFNINCPIHSVSRCMHAYARSGGQTDQIKPAACRDATRRINFSFAPTISRMLLRLCRLHKRAAKFRMQPCRNGTLDHFSCTFAFPPRFPLETNGSETPSEETIVFSISHRLWEFYFKLPLCFVRRAENVARSKNIFPIWSLFGSKCVYQTEKLYWKELFLEKEKLDTIIRKSSGKKKIEIHPSNKRHNVPVIDTMSARSLNRSRLGKSSAGF